MRKSIVVLCMVLLLAGNALAGMSYIDPMDGNTHSLPDNAKFKSVSVAGSSIISWAPYHSDAGAQTAYWDSSTSERTPTAGKLSNVAGQMQIYDGSAWIDAAGYAILQAADWITMIQGLSGAGVLARTSVLGYTDGAGNGYQATVADILGLIAVGDIPSTVTLDSELAAMITLEADCTDNTSGACVNSSTGVVYGWDGDSMEIIGSGAGGSDAFTVKIAADGTAGYLGTDGTDGVLRAGTNITIARTGDYITISASQATRASLGLDTTDDVAFGSVTIGSAKFTGAYAAGSLPGSPSSGDVIIVTGGFTACDNSTGGGSYVSLQRYNGSSWDCIGDGGSTGITISTDCSGVTTSGAMCWESDAKQFWIGDGSAAVNIGPGEFETLSESGYMYNDSGTPHAYVAASVSDINTGSDTTKPLTADALAGSTPGRTAITLRAYEDGTTLETGDSKDCWTVPSWYNGWNVVAVFGSVGTASSSGSPTFQLRNATDAQDILSTALTIDATETHSGDPTTPAVINTSYDDLATGDKICMDIDNAGTGTTGGDMIFLIGLP